METEGDINGLTLGHRLLSSKLFNLKMKRYVIYYVT